MRPSLLVPVWVDGLLERTIAFPSLRKRVKKVWDRMADEFLELKFVRERDTWSPNDLVDGLQRALKFSQQLSTGWASSVVTWMHELCGDRRRLVLSPRPGGAGLPQPAGNAHRLWTHARRGVHAAGRQLRRRPRAEPGRTSTPAPGGACLRQTMLAPQEHEFIPSDVMTYLAFYRGDERGGRPFETWSGTLGMCPSDAAVHRIDTPVESSGYGHAIPASGVPINAPHFAAQPAKSVQVPVRRHR